jgi:hypothetical protein
MKVTNVIVGRLLDQYVAIDNNHCNTQFGHIVVERAQVPHDRNSCRLCYTFDGYHVGENRRFLRQRHPFDHD